MLELYVGKLEDKTNLELHAVEQDMRSKVKEFLGKELKLTEEKQQGIFFMSSSTTRMYKFYKKNAGNLVELEVVYNGGSYTHRLTGYGSTKVMKPLAKKITQLYDEYALKKESGRTKGFVKE